LEDAVKATVVYEGKRRFTAHCENERITFDLPLGMGGDAKGVSPPEAFAVSLAACAGYYALFYCNEKNLSADGMVLSMEGHKDKKRVTHITTEIALPNVDVEKHREGIMKAIEDCIVKSSIEVKPDITFILK
jgi:ribosomal protein S12 methylthiotransferase accessory factor